VWRCGRGEVVALRLGMAKSFGLGNPSQSMIARFIGTNGAANLRTAVLEQRVVQNSAPLADRLIAAGTILEHKTNEVLIQQEGVDEFVFFIVSGEVAIELNGGEIARRSATECVGEMSAVDPSAPRTATVRATSPVVTLRVECSDFVSIANETPGAWRAVARVIAERLRQRRRFHRVPNAKPVLFVGSSVEGLPVAKQIQLGMKHEPVEVRVWTDGIFGPGGVAVDKLSEQVDQADFAVFVFGPDDKVASRDHEHYAPRDNVVFEMGMFISQLGRSRAYLVKEQSSDIKIPSDLLGITPLTYVADPKAKWEVVLGPVCTEIARIIKELGPI
jgi:CRP/FNR family cyclic AMP-dependent transcriptional regulator